MSEEIKVRVVEFGDRPNYMLQYTDPLTGRKKSKTAKAVRSGKKADRDAAQREAGALEKELREGTYLPPSKISWDDFRDRYESEVLPSLAVETGNVLATVFSTLEKIISPKRLADLTADRLSFYQSELRAGKHSRNGTRSEATIRTYLAHLKAALKWATEMGLLREVPKIIKPKRAKNSKVMKGRPINLEEFERMLAKVPAVVLYEKFNPKPPKTPKPIDPAREASDKLVVERWRFYLRGLYLSGFRLAESLDLYWDRPDKLCIDFTGKRPTVRIPAALEKGNQDRHMPLSPEFAEMLMAVPESERRGRVFKLLDRNGNPRCFAEDWVGRVISKIGKRAGVIVSTSGKTKFASAHDLRRSFGERWSARVMPQVLMELMRHESIETTLRYYVGRNAQRTAEVLWEAHANASNNSGNNGQSAVTANEKGSTQTVAASSLS